MKRRINYLALVFFAVASLAIAQQSKNFTNLEVDNLISAIKSDNPGLQKSAIYLAGYYRVIETVEAIKEEMNTSEDPSIKVLAALTLYEIGSGEAIDDILSLVDNTNVDPKVRNLAEAIHDYWTSRKYSFTTTTQ